MLDPVRSAATPASPVLPEACRHCAASSKARILRRHDCRRVKLEVSPQHKIKGPLRPASASSDGSHIAQVGELASAPSASEHQNLLDAIILRRDLL